MKAKFNISMKKQHNTYKKMKPKTTSKIFITCTNYWLHFTFKYLINIFISQYRYIIYVMLSKKNIQLRSMF